MPWIIGVDEAGYGPNLGPFVMTSVACRVPEELAAGDLWHALRPAVRRRQEADDGRLLIEDSKLVYSTTRGIQALETGVLVLLAAQNSATNSSHATLTQLLGSLCPDAHANLCEECWFTGTTAVPVAANADDLRTAAGRLTHACSEVRLGWGLVRSVIVCPARFNGLLDRWGSKGAVLALALAELLRANHDPDEGTEAVSFCIDKHGGRNNYAALLQQAVPDGMVLVVEEGRERSVYRVAGLKRDIRLTFTPRADAAHLCVALASMVSKYLRELLMQEFNRFWQGHVPGLKPTAGYPGDAARFFTDIRSAVALLGISEVALWRRK
jgi:hypothetical protein